MNLGNQILMLCALADFFHVTTDELLGRNKLEEIIICDDAPIIRDALYAILTKEGYQKITLAEKGEQLLDAISKSAPYAVFLDINLPNVNGIELLKKIKAQSSKTKVIMVTADTSEEIRNLAIAYGADAYVTKPFLPEHIKTVISTM